MPSISMSEERPTEDSNGSKTTIYSSTLKQAIEVADKVAQRWSTSTHWSSWHVWDVFRRCYNDSSSPNELWREAYPFATCVRFTFSVADDLRATYKATNGLEHFSDKIQTVASSLNDESDPDPVDEPKHCALTVFCEEACILIDLIYSPRALVVPLGGSADSPEYVTLSGRRGKRAFSYTEIPEGKKLNMWNPKIENNPYIFRFWPITHAEAFRAISVPLHSNIYFPASKIVVIKNIVRDRPTKVPATQLDSGHWQMTICRLQIEFVNMRLTLQIPLADWLLKPENCRHHSIQDHDMFRKLDDGVANLTVELSRDRGDETTREHLKTLGVISNSLGLPAPELERIAASIYEAWENL